MTNKTSRNTVFIKGMVLDDGSYILYRTDNKRLYHADKDTFLQSLLNAERFIKRISPREQEI